MRYTWTYKHSLIVFFVQNFRIISYLPLSHIAAQMIDIIAAVMIGHTVWFAQPDALKGTIKNTLLVMEEERRERERERKRERRRERDRVVV